ncbi:MAG: Mth938-like domain-containing protein [Alphaproteobacteria bacterium]
MSGADFIDSTSEDPRLINGYDNNGFRIKENRYDGAIIIFGEQIIPWQDVQTIGDITVESLQIFLNAKEKPELILIGTGANFIAPPLAIRNTFKEHHMALEWMNTKAAMATWPILLADGRHVAGCFLPTGS